ncbi:AGAP007923-PA-like protein [Anopheles sinensis]|uniref:AGAP007923-PA-like protein n=1 Tax=Anopheles sinensis TaxID=74873 RepID=A0A084VP37_ANOSI|nr:AGAP007923-PA-like protein [Anopheles sinensis]
MFWKLVPTYHSLCGSCLGCLQDFRNPTGPTENAGPTGSPPKRIEASGGGSTTCNNNYSIEGVKNVSGVGEIMTNGFHPDHDPIGPPESESVYRRLVRTHPDLVRMCQWCFFKRRKQTPATPGCPELTEITNVVPFDSASVFQTPQKKIIARDGGKYVREGLGIFESTPTNGPSSTSSSSNDAFISPNGYNETNGKQLVTAHAQKRDIDQQSHATPSKCYNNQTATGEPNNRSNSATHGERYFGDFVNGRRGSAGGGGGGAGTAPSTPSRARFLGDDLSNDVPVINQESYIIQRDEHYDSEQDERSSNDSTSTRIISNSIFNLRDRDRDRVTVLDDRGSFAPSVASASRPQSVSSHKSIGSGALKQQQQLTDGRLSRTSNVSYARNHSASDNVSLKSNRSATGKSPLANEEGEWYGERAATPITSEIDGISSNQIQYESDYDVEDDDARKEDSNGQVARPMGTPKRYPTPSPLPLQGSYSTENLSMRNAFHHEAHDDEDEEIEEEIDTLPRSRGQSASLGNLRHLPNDEDRTGNDEPPVGLRAAPKKKKPFLVRRSSRVAPVKEAASGVKTKNKLNEVIFQKTLRKFDKPKDALNNCLSHLESPNWEQNISGLQFFVRLIRHHPEVIDTQIHLLSVALAKQVRNLRSQVARAACQASGEFFSTHRRCIEGEAEDIATHLLHRTADTNKFLRADATQALESMCDNISIPKVVHIIAFKGATHQNAVVRTTAAKLLDKIVQKIGSEKVFALPKETRDKLILTGAHLLLEGSLETRNFTKSVFRQLSDHPNYSKVLLEVIPSRTYRNIEKSLNSIRQMS